MKSSQICSQISCEGLSHRINAANRLVCQSKIRKMKTYSNSFLALNMVILFGFVNSAKNHLPFIAVMKAEGYSIGPLPSYRQLTPEFSTTASPMELHDNEMFVQTEDAVELKKSLSKIQNDPLINPPEVKSPFTSTTTVRKYVTIHVPPESSKPNIIRVGGEPDTHINIVFVKVPSVRYAKPTEVILPDPPQYKNIVYVLLNKEEPQHNIRIQRPKKLKPTRPEVYFIQYKTPSSSSSSTNYENIPYSQPQQHFKPSLGDNFVEAYGRRYLQN